MIDMREFLAEVFQGDGIVLDIDRTEPLRMRESADLA